MFVIYAVYNVLCIRKKKKNKERKIAGIEIII